MLPTSVISGPKAQTPGWRDDGELTPTVRYRLDV